MGCAVSICRHVKYIRAINMNKNVLYIPLEDLCQPIKWLKSIPHIKRLETHLTPVYPLHHPCRCWFPGRKCVCGKPGWMRHDIIIALSGSLCCLSPYEKHSQPSVTVTWAGYCYPKGLEVFIAFRVIRTHVTLLYVSQGNLWFKFTSIWLHNMLHLLPLGTAGWGGHKHAYLYAGKNLIIQLGTVLNE